MALSNDNKKKMYEFEKYAVVIVIILAVVIIALVMFGTKSVDGIDTTSGNDLEGLVNNDDSSSTTDDKVDIDYGSISGINFTTIIVDNSALTTGDLVVANSSYELSVDISQEVKIPISDAFGLNDYSVKLKQDAILGIEPMLAGFYEAKEIKSSYIVTKGYDGSDASSDHATGLGFNITVNDGRIGEGVYDWYYDNCWKYGYIVRYPSGKDLATGYDYEYNHFRYVGVPHALYMYRKNLALEEYIGDLKLHTTYQNPVSLDSGSSGASYMAYAVIAEDGGSTNISVPTEDSGWTYTISGTNCGCYIVTLCKNV